MNPKPDLDFELYAESLRRCIENYKAIVMEYDIQKYKEVQKYSETIPVINLEESIKRLEEISNRDDYKPDEKDLKKRIKHSKTPMERKMYEKQLNELYKKRRSAKQKAKA